MLRYALTLIATLTSAFAAVIFVFSWFDDAAPTGLAAKVFLAALIIGYNVVLLHHLWMRATRASLPWVVFGGGLLLLAIGSAGIAWTAHLGQISGDWESSGFVAGLLLIIEGALAAVQVTLGDANLRKLAA